MPVNDMRRRKTGVSRLLPWIAVAIALISAWALSRRPSEVEQTRRHFVELQRQVAAARDTRSARASDRGRVLRLRAQARTASGAQRERFAAEAAAIEMRLEWGDRATVRPAVLSAPLIRSPLRTSAPAGVVPVTSADGNGNGCVGCHVAVASVGFETYPAPFRTHPNLASYVGPASPHAPSRVGCAACHRGDGHAQTFSAARHSTLRTGAAAAIPGTAREWADVHTPGVMLPLGRTEAGCVTCHAGERYQPGAAALNEAIITLDRGGCSSCHALAGPAPTSKRGPDLRRIRGKLSPEWVKAWLAAPRAIKPATWMPHFWSADRLSETDVAAIDAVTAYLFANSEDYAPAAAARRGDAARGQRVVESVGCLGCHVLGDVARDGTSVRRTFGQPLQAVGSKTTYAWLVDWLGEPSRYSPETRMPSLRLTSEDAADAAAYLTTLKGDVQAISSGPIDAARYREVVRSYRSASPGRLDEPVLAEGEELRTLAGATVIAALGCVNCHEIRGVDGQRPSMRPIAPRPVWRDADATVHGRVRAAAVSDGAAHAGSPDLGLGKSEVARVALALTAVAGDAPEAHAMSMPWHVTKVAGRTLAQERNCVGCHVIEGVGGDFVTLVAEPSLGPPLLTPEGSRVQPDWLRRFLHEPRTIRPWLSVRMPTFRLSDDDVTAIGDYLRAIAPANPKPAPAAPGVTAAVGQELFDLLKCQQCHVLGTVPQDQPTANLAPDLRLAAERLQPDWVLAWLRDPSAILPGTRMPTFWPDYPKSFYEPLNRDGALQVQAIRNHVMTIR